MPEPLRTIHYQGGTVQRIYATWVETDIPGRETLYAVPMPCQRGQAHALGYEGPKAIDAMTRDHDPLHCWLADALGLPASASLTQAIGGEVSAEVALAEEEAVLAVQRYMRLAGGGMPV